MLIQWTHVLDRLAHANVPPGVMQEIARLGSERFAQTDLARQAWAALADTPVAKLRTQFLKALQLSGLSDALTEEVWRQFLRQEPHLIPSGPADDLLHDALEIAATRINDLEWPPLSNQGDDVLPYMHATGINAGDQWCMAFVYWCVAQAARNQEKLNPLKPTGSCAKQWAWAKSATGLLEVLPIAQALKEPGRIRAGAIFIHQYGDGHGHTGFVEAIHGQQLITIEGNTNPFGIPKVGLGVYRCSHRALTDAAIVGFIQV